MEGVVDVENYLIPENATSQSCQGISKQANPQNGLKQLHFNVFSKKQDGDAKPGKEYNESAPQ